ncbi:MAG: diguanylate cyclase [Candidatus Scalindua sediminis]|nr:diguanylate cyclase [Candidatus Scalindua sediminis]
MKILIAEDENISRRRLEKFLKDMDYEVISCKDGLEAWEVIQSENAPNLMILDWMIPGMDGVEICRKIRKLAKESYTFILLLTSKSKQEDIIKGIEAGANEYITKPFNQQELIARLRTGKHIIELNKNLLYARNVLRKKAIYDELTGLHNRHYMVEILEKEFSRAIRYQTDLSCLLLDIDYFKDLNDTFGHPFGDFVLHEFSGRMKQEARETDFLFRYGGEEFMLLLPNTGIDGTQNIAERIHSACETRKYDDGTNSTTATVSIGVSSVKLHQPSKSNELIAFADKALYRAKAEGRNRVKVYMDGSSWQYVNGEICEDKDIRYLKENISSILEKTKKAAVESLGLLVREIDDSKYQKHNQQVKQYIKLIGERLNLPPSITDTFKRAASLHYNFKTLLDKTLKSENKAMNANGKTEIKDHPYMMAELTELFDFFGNERSVLLYHHENFDGSGYSEGLKANEIPLGARLFAIVDAIATMSSKKPFGKSLPAEKVIEELAHNTGRQFDPMLVSLFFDIIEEKGLLNVPGEVLKKARKSVREAMAKVKSLST